MINPLSRMIHFKRVTNFFLKSWPIIQNVLWSLLVATVVAIGISFILTRTQYLYWVDDAFSNLHGFYEIVLFFVIIILTLYNIGRIWPFVQRAFLANQITIIDRLIFAVVLWGIVLWLPTAWYGKVLPSTDWGGLLQVVRFCQIFWTFALILLVARVGFGRYQISMRKPPIQKPRLLSDHSIGSQPNAKDLLGRSNVVNQIISVIKDFDSEKSFVVAVTGEWGAGKTTVLDLTLQRLKEDENIIPVAFDPWYFSVGNGQNLDTLLKRFFDTLEGAIRSRVFRPNISKVLSRYYKAITPIIEKAPLNLSFLFDEGQGDLKAIQKELNDIFIKLDAKVVVFIDDLDRMDGLEIAFVFKLIRLCANFDNLVYVIAFDRSFVQEQLEKEFGSKAKDYIDKIIQLELPLPKVEPGIFGDIFVNYLGEAEQQLGINLLQDQDFVDRVRLVINPYIIFLLNNIRLVKSFMNHYLLVVPIIKGEVNYFDLLVLEIIRLRYPQIYEAIYRYPGYFTYRNNINWAIPRNESQKVSQFFEDLFASAKLNDEESKNAVLSLLGSVFNSVDCYHHKYNVIWNESHDSIYRDRKSAAHPYYFPRYFYLAVQQGVFSDVEWDNFIAQINVAGEDELKQLIDTTITEHLRANATPQWFGQMRLSVPKINSEQIPTLLLAITNRAKDFSDESTGFLELADYRLMEFLVVDLLRRLDPGQVEEVALKLIESCPDVEFLRDLMYWFNPERTEKERTEPEFTQVDFHRLKQCAGERLRQTYIKEGRNILIELHHRGGLYALKYFLEPAEYKPYIHHLLKQDGQNALLFLKALTSRGHIYGGRKVDVFRVLDYSTAKSFLEPQRILVIAEDFKSISEMTEDEAWAVDALREGIETEAEGKVVERISERNRSS